MCQWKMYVNTFTTWAKLSDRSKDSKNLNILEYKAKEHLFNEKEERENN